MTPFVFSTPFSSPRSWPTFTEVISEETIIEAGASRNCVNADADEGDLVNPMTDPWEWYPSRTNMAPWKQALLKKQVVFQPLLFRVYASLPRGIR